MSDRDPRSAESAPPASATAAAPDKREWALRVVDEIFRHLGVRPRLDLKDGADGGISIAVQLDAEVPGVQPGKRSHVLDALQFLANKIVNRPGSDRRWISIGIGGHPELRPREPRRSPDSSSQGAPNNPAAGRASPRVANGRPASTAVPKALEDDEALVQPGEDADLAAAARSIGEKASSLGRFFAIVGMKREDRARALRSVEGMQGVRVSAEGVGRNRRVVFTPDKPAPVSKRSLPMAEEDEQER
jgi:predicted RNA-binding protein Jag